MLDVPDCIQIHNAFLPDSKFGCRRHRRPPDDLVFQSVKDGQPIRDNNILTRYLKPAGRKLGLPFVNWRCLRTSHATWLKLAGADPKDIQGQMRHSRISTTPEIYTQFVPESQRRAVDRLTELATTSIQ